MKQVMTILFSCLALLQCQAQNIELTTDKTTSLVFPFAIRHVDRGTGNILIEPVAESDHILLVKAAVKDFAPTNLSVITADGSVYAFPVRYIAQPESFVYRVPALKNASVETYANGILDNPRTSRGILSHHWHLFGGVTGIYIKDQVIYYQLRLFNRSSIDYDIDFIRFYIRDRKKSKRTAVQEHELKPLFISGNVSQVKAQGRTTIVVALDKFTLPDAKWLAIEINEKNGGRHLLMKLNNAKIIRALPLPDLH